MIHRCIAIMTVLWYFWSHCIAITEERRALKKRVPVIMTTSSQLEEVEVLHDRPGLAYPHQY